MQALILAAGMGKRLGALTKNNTKCMVKVNGVSLIERLLRQLCQLDIGRIVIVVGYKKKELIEYIETLKISKPVEFISNDVFDTTNNIYSLYLAKDKLLEDDTILVGADLILDDSRN